MSESKENNEAANVSFNKQRSSPKAKLDHISEEVKELEDNYIQIKESDAKEFQDQENEDRSLQDSIKELEGRIKLEHDLADREKKELEKSKVIFEENLKKIAGEKADHEKQTSKQIELYQLSIEELKQKDAQIQEKIDKDKEEINKIQEELAKLAKEEALLDYSKKKKQLLKEIAELEERCDAEEKLQNQEQCYLRQLNETFENEKKSFQCRISEEKEKYYKAKDLSLKKSLEAKDKIKSLEDELVKAKSIKLQKQDHYNELTEKKGERLSQLEKNTENYREGFESDDSRITEINKDIHDYDIKISELNEKIKCIRHDINECEESIGQKKKLENFELEQEVEKFKELLDHKKEELKSRFEDLKEKEINAKKNYLQAKKKNEQRNNLYILVICIFILLVVGSIPIKRFYAMLFH
ncbi:unnamed protein product [Moneuplotes crassus]|uniref:Uncharacterized protein n=1 Tax=Euplotes crassus TaxID=5936 RepID=A0AAD1UJ79_EUPCR|nr:unnamed protein product [Moneuplotes crassus]